MMERAPLALARWNEEGSGEEIQEKERKKINRTQGLSKGVAL